MTVHNLAFPGKAPREMLQHLFLPPQAFAIDGVEFHGGLSLLKAGLQFADRITTVSPTYAAEITTPEHGMGFDGLLRMRGAALSGILNGIDTEVWNPATDPHLAATYNTPAGRAVNKTALQRELGLTEDADAPLFAVVSRLTHQKGLDVLLECLDGSPGQLVVLGTGDPRMEAGFRAANSPRVAAVIGYDEGHAHRIQAGADVLLVPSRFEPCGLTQLCALRYGAVPLVARVGGLADTVIDANPAAVAAGVATGFQFAPLTAETLAGTMRHAATLHRDPAVWQRIQANGMASDVSWRAPARAYVALYRSLA
jgi:starch synthase